MSARTTIALACWAQLLSGCGRDQVPPNVLLITIDTLRADHLGCYGYVRDTSPNLDRLARAGVRFRVAIAQGSWTYTALPSLVSSRYPQDHADFWVLRQGEPWAAGRVASGSPTIGELFRRRGYRTALVAGHSGLGRIIGLTRGIGRKDVGDHDARELTDRAIALLGALRGSPFFLWLHYMDPHGPYEAPEPFRDRFVGDGKVRTGRTIRVGERRNLSLSGLAQNALLGSHRDLDFYVARYDGEIAYVDAEFGRLLARLEAADLERGTLVVVTADHGEMLGEEDLYGHVLSLRGPVVNVPLVVAWPGHVRPRVIGSPVMHVDLLPTLAELVGGLQPDRSWAGRSLAGCLAGAPCPAPEAFSTRGREVSLRTERWKLICSNPIDTCRLFDAAADPLEAADVSSRHPTVARELRSRLGRWVHEHPDDRARGAFGELAEPDAESRSQLRALGYAE